LGVLIKDHSHRSWVSAVLGVVLSFCSVNVYAIDEQPAFSDDSRQDRYLTLVHELRCVVCQNQTIADSNADLAADLRAQVRGLIASGRTDEEIKRYLTDRYGDFILYDPPFNAQSALLWLAPGFFVLLGVFIIFRVVRNRSHALEQDTRST
jgi:cytochrome c-type biogenesis protein CcmH